MTLTQNESASSLFLGYGGGTSGTLNLGASTLTAATIFDGFYGTTGVINHGAGGTGSINVSSLFIGNSNSYGFGLADVVANLNLYTNAQATTAATGNLTASAYVDNQNLGGTPATLTLGADLSLSGNLDLRNGGVVAAAGHTISANQILLGYYSSAPGEWSLTSRGNLTTANLYVNGNGASGPINLTASDSVTNFSLYGGATTTFATGAAVSSLTLYANAQATTTATGNVTTSVAIDNQNVTGTPATLTLGADLSLSGSLNLLNGGVVNANGHGITASTVFVGWYSGGTNAQPSMINDAGPLVATNLYMNFGSSMTISGGTISSFIDLQGNSTLTVKQADGQTTGLTFLGSTANSLVFDPSSIDLVFGSTTGVDWDFRWKDPATGGNWISTIDGLIASGNFVISSPYGYSVYDSNGYTYIGYDNTAVPEPASLALFGIGGAIVGVGTWRKRRRSA